MKSCLSRHKQVFIVMKGIFLCLLVCLCRPVDSKDLKTVDNSSTIMEILRMKFGEDYLKQCYLNENCDSRQNIIFCKCDLFCNDFNDCCNKQSRSPQLLTNCSPLSLSGTNPTGLFVNLYSKCPLQWKDEIVRGKCENPGNLGLLEKLFVSSRYTNLTYQNVYCARCHRVSSSELDIWKISVTCKTFSKQRNVSMFSLLSEYSEDKSCEYKYVSEYKYHRRCYVVPPSYIQTCPNGYDGPFREECEHYPMPVFINNEYNEVYRSYRNIGCLQCDDHRLSESEGRNLSVHCSQINGGDSFGLTAVLDFADVIHKRNTDVLKLFCKENETQVRAINKCVELFCPGRSVPFFGECIPYGVDTSTMILSILLHVNGSVSLDVFRKSVESLANDIRSICQRSYLISIDYIQISYGMNMFSNQSCILAKVNIELDFLTLLKDLWMCYEKNLVNMSIKITNDIFMQYINNVSITQCSTDTVLENLQSVYQPDTTFSDLMECPSIEVFSELSSQIRRKDDNESHVFIVGDITIDSSYVYGVNDRFFVCLSLFEIHYEHASRSVRKYRLNYIVTYTCMSTSVLSLFVTLVHYIAIPNMIQNNSIVILHLVINIMLSQSAFLVSVVAAGNAALCWWYGVLLHFLYLSMFASMSLSLLHVNIQLRKMLNPSSEKKFCKVIGYFIVPGYIISVIIVLLTTLLNVFVYPLQPWYGDNVCFITDSFVLLATFAFPVACSIVFNISVYASIVYFFHSHRGDKATLDINRSYFRVLLKLSTIMGSTWMIGFCAVFTRIEALEYIFEATSSLQGLFISVSLLTGQNVRNWYKQRLLFFYKHRQNDNSTSTSNS